MTALKARGGDTMSNGEIKFIAFISVIAGFLVLPVIATIFDIDVKSIPKIVILLTWFFSAKVISSI